MKTILVLMMLMISSAYAEPIKVDKPIICDKFSTVIDVLTNGESKESPVWIGKDENSNFSLLTNEKTKTWTIIQFNGTIACVLGSGDKQQFVKNNNGFWYHID